MRGALRLLLLGLVGGLPVAAGLALSMEQVVYINYNRCTTPSGDPEYPFAAILVVKAKSPVTVSVSATSLLNSTWVRVVVEAPPGAVVVGPGESYEASLSPGERLEVRVYCGLLGLGDREIPLAQVGIAYRRDVAAAIVGIVAVLVGVAVVGRGL